MPSTSRRQFRLSATAASPRQRMDQTTVTPVDAQNSPASKPPLPFQTRYGPNAGIRQSHDEAKGRKPVRNCPMLYGIGRASAMMPTRLPANTRAALSSLHITEASTPTVTKKKSSAGRQAIVATNKSNETPPPRKGTARSGTNASTSLEATKTAPSNLPMKSSPEFIPVRKSNSRVRLRRSSEKSPTLILRAG